VAAPWARIKLIASAATMKNARRAKGRARLENFSGKNKLIGRIANLDDAPGHAVTNFVCSRSGTGGEA
jgi:hypothetical protein